MTALATASNAPRRYIAVGAIALFAVVRTPRITYFPEQSAYRVLPQIAAHLLLTLTNYRYRALAVRFGLSPDGLFLQNVLYEQPAAIYTNFSAPEDARANATFVVLARNSEAKGVEQSIRDIEARFNAQYQYPYVFLNDEEFTDEFKACVMMSIKMCDSADGLLQACAGAHRRTGRVRFNTKRALEPARLDRRGACARVAQEDEA